MSQYNYLKQQIAPHCQAGIFLCQLSPEMITLQEAIDSCQIGAWWLEEADANTPPSQEVTQTVSDSTQSQSQYLSLVPKELCEKTSNGLNEIAANILPMLQDPYIEEKIRIALTASYVRLKEAAIKYHFASLYYGKLEDLRRLNTPDSNGLREEL